MSCRGVFFALTDEEFAALLAASSEEERQDLVQEVIEAKWDEANVQEVDKAWEAIHRILSQQPADVEGMTNGHGVYPLNQVIYGDRQLCATEDYLINLNEPNVVDAIANAIESLSEEWFLDQFKKHCSGAYSFADDEDDAAYCAGWFESVRDFYVSKRGSGRPIIFTVDF